jgi:diacylglycerol kinase family enzyme
MKFAVVINVGSGSEAREFALKTHSLLLEQVGERLDSIRLAVPRLLQAACISAVAEAPDVLVVAGGPRTARRAGQIAYEQGVPLLFLPGLRSPRWAKPLWDSLPLEAMIAALACEEVSPARIAVGMAGDQVFFGDARVGLLPQLAEVHGSFFESETMTESWRSLGRAASLAQSMAHPAVRICSSPHDFWASALIVTAQDGKLSCQRPCTSAAELQLHFMEASQCDGVHGGRSEGRYRRGLAAGGRLRTLRL